MASGKAGGLGSRNHELGQPPSDIMRFLGGGVFYCALVGWDSLLAVRLDSTASIFWALSFKWGGSLLSFLVAGNDFDIIEMVYQVGFGICRHWH